jgi:hypothetical protein
MFRRRATLAILPILLLAASAVRADTIHIVEGSGGFPIDFPGDEFEASVVAPIGVLGIGANTVSGSLQGSPSLGGTDSADLFYLMLPSGLSITSAQIDITGFDYGGGTITNSGEIEEPGSSVSISDNGTYGLSPFATPGNFLVTVNVPNSLDFDESEVPPVSFFSGQLDYTITYNVQVDASTAPLPGVLSLGAVMLPLAALATRRRFPRIV